MSCKDVDKETMEFFDKIFRLDPMFFSKAPNTKSAQEVQWEQMEITVIDIWLNKIKKYGWKIKDIPKKYKELRKELKRRLKENGSQGRKSAP